ELLGHGPRIRGRRGRHPPPPRRVGRRSLYGGALMGAEWTHTGFAQQIHFGVGAMSRLPELLRTLSVKRVMPVSTKGRLSSDDGQRVAKGIGRNLAATFDDVASHVPTPSVQAAVQ